MKIRRAKKSTLILGTLLGFGAALSLTLGPALAAATLTINSSGALLANGAGVQVSGTETCSFSSNLGPIVQGVSGSETDSLTVTVTQRFGHTVASGSGTLTGSNGSSEIPCDGSPHAWTVNVSASAGGDRFGSGSATAQANYQACTVLNSQLLCEQGQAQRTIKISG
jgi:hypothetical protein